ncbi:hypothetical protein [Protaetiibacter intestinalis]|uniref:hypothetical protein n=1 Tax=Protaetiibacter intestinalis TaxID=2419774 RepID=UPI001300AE34|nr:hypothetical protein [Protaetiibacter intestinalis]
MLLLTLVGCVPSDPPVTPPPTSADPVFASDEEALAAAEEAYRAYISAVDDILASGGVDSGQLDGLVSPEVLAVQEEGFQQFRDLGWRATGSTILRNFTLQQFDGESMLVLYVCSDVSDVDVVDAEGVSQVSADRPTTTTFESSLAYDGRRFTVETDDPWEGSGVC